EEEFFHFSAGIVLQAYLPDSYQMQKELTEWAMDRVAAGGAPIKIRLVKGANLAMEQVESSLHHWPQAPFSTKIEVDANYKRMMLYAFEPEHAQAVHIGIGSHNLFDIAFSLLLVAERGIREFVAYEMLEGMAEPMQRVVHALSGGMLLYCPVATEREFPYAVSYLVRRLDENSAPQNFLRHAFCLKVGSAEWDRQVAAFNKSCRQIERISSQPRRTQDRGCTPRHVEIHQPFQNEPETDWALPQNQRWISEVVKQWKNRVIDDVANGIGGKDSFDEKRASYGNNPSTGDNRLYRYALGSMEQLELALNTTQSAKAEWSRVPPGERARLLYELAQQLRLRRSEFLGAMMVSCGKTAVEADTEFNEAIDFVEYYRHNLLTHYQLEDVDWNPKGCVVVTPPWNFPVSIPTGGVAAALAAGNVVILKPAREAVLVARMLAEACWDAGIPKNVLQFFACDDEEVGSALIRDRRVDVVLLTGATATGELFLKMRPDLDLYAETGGKNTLIVTQTADRDLAIKAIVQSAFGHSGQKCSACSLLILEAELYDDMRFRAQLKDAVESLHVGSALDLKTRINPLILPPGDKLRRGLTELEPGQSWLLEPKQVGENPHLWSPGIKLGVTIGSDAYETEYFGPVLGVMRADDLQEALQIANTMVYGLTAGIISLDEKEQEWWLNRIEAGNCYINRGITGAIVERQPFGGTLASSFGRGAKAGGPNYLLQLMRPTQVALPHLQEVVNNAVSALEKWVVRTDLLDNHELSLLKKSLGNYAYYWKHFFSVKHDPQLLLGQDNLQTYRPDPLFFILQQGDSLCDQLRVIAAALTVGAPIHVHGAPELVERLGEVGQLCTSIHSRGTHEFIEILEAHIHPRVRTVTRPSEELFAALAELPARILCEPVLANGRIELLNCLREVSISRDYHRYGNLGARESETRAQLVQT
ncbi:MAG: proline dehydrogenase family protein, partial [Chlamydiia bacterium]|nr:proline dehydrogenase family protein [Chlamydiia bacterium]